MPKHILVATDLSSRSDRALRRAVRLARIHHTRLTLLHVLDDALPDDMLRPLQKQATQHLEHLAATQMQGLGATLLPCVGDPTGMLVEQIEDQSPDLLVLGTHRARPLLDGLRETTAQRVVRLTSAPVLVVTQPDDLPYDHILAATDFSPAAAAALNLGHALAPKARLTPINALHIPYQGMLGGQSEQAAQALAASFLAEATAADTAWRARTALPVTLAQTQFPQGSPWAILNHHATQDSAQLITAGAHGRIGAHRALLGSLATDLMRDPPCDVLIARPRDHAPT